MIPSSSFISIPKIDEYTVYARILPVLLVILPGALAALAWFPEAKTWWGAVSGLLVGCGLAVLLAQLGRDAGKRKEAGLYESWGGKPTTRLLRHRDAVNKVQLLRRHRKLQELVAGVQIPSEQEEAADPRGADDAYDACVGVLREKTRDRTRFPILYDELSSYGFRRNLWGMKPLGVTLVLAAGIAIAVLIVLRVREAAPLFPMTIVAAAGDVILLALWMFWITPSWVRTPAEGYAEQLLASMENL